MRHALGIDLGSSSCKVSAMAESGEILVETEAPIRTWTPGSGMAEQDATEWYAAVCTAIHACLSRSDLTPSAVSAVAVVAGAHFFVLLDAEGSPLGRVIHWSDRRAYRQAAQLRDVAGEEFSKVSRQPMSAGASPAQLAWIREHEPEIWAAAKYILPAKDYIRYRLTGVIATDPYDAAGLQLWDATSSRWSSSLCNVVGVEQKMLPEVLPSNSIAGGVSADAARETGLAEGTPVAVGSGDSAVEAASVGMLDPGDTVVKLGTSANVEVVLAEPRFLPAALVYPYVVGERWIALTATNTGASAVRWFCGLFAASGPGSGPVSVSSRRCSETLQAAATVSPGADGLLFHPFLAGERSPHWNDRLRGTFLGLRANHTRAHLIRAVLEGVAYSVRECLEAIGSCDPGVVRLIGGGAKSEVWRQVLSDVLRLPLQVPEHSDASVGACMIASVASGLTGGWAEAVGRRPLAVDTVEPTAEASCTYDAMFKLYKEAVRPIASVSEALEQIATERRVQS